MKKFTSSYVVDCLYVERMYNNRGSLIINDSLLVYSYAKLKDNQPSWLDIRIKPIVKGEGYSPSIRLHDVEVPFIIRKEKRDFYLMLSRMEIQFNLS